MHEENKTSNIFLKTCKKWSFWKPSYRREDNIELDFEDMLERGELD